MRISRSVSLWAIVQTLLDRGDLLDLMLDWVPDAGTRDRILAHNANVLYGFK